MSDVSFSLSVDVAIKTDNWGNPYEINEHITGADLPEDMSEKVVACIKREYPGAIETDGQ